MKKEENNSLIINSLMLSNKKNLTSNEKKQIQLLDEISTTNVFLII